MRQLKNLLGLINRFYTGIKYGVFKYKNIKVPFCNDFKVGINYVYEQRVLFPHPIGIVIGKGVEIGKNCTIYQNVTLGTKDGITYPKIENNVIIFANSVIFGDITIGENSIIGAGSIVFKNVPSNSLVFGNPACIQPIK